MRRRAWTVALMMAVGLAGAVEATQTLFTDFEGFKTGASINGQNGWGRTGPYDEQVVNALGRVAEQRGISRAQVAMGWLLSRPGVTSPIVGATKPHHLDDAVAALGVHLSKEETAALEASYIPHPVMGFS